MRVLRFIARIWTVLLGSVALAFTLAFAVRFVLPLAPWLQHPIVTISPRDGSTDVTPRSPITLTFSQPMNRDSVLKALRIQPDTPGTFAWSDDGRRLTFNPDTVLTSGVTYTISLDGRALGRWWQPLRAPVRVAFGTARSPTLVAALPNGDELPTDTPVALVFSQPMVAPAELNTPVELPQLRIDPPLDGEARWIAVDTLLLQPTARMQPATRYQATIADLPDVRGIELDQSFTWTWATRAPDLLARSPDDGDRWVAPRQPLVLTFSQPLDLGVVRAGLTLTPTMTGDLAAALQPGGTQVVTFTPALEWEPDRTYEVAFAPQPPADDTPPAAFTWRFTTAPSPALVGRFPGQGQLLPRGQAIRLIFSTPMEADALRAGLTLEPAVEGIDIVANETMVRLNANLQPSTAYTLTVTSDVTDRNGVPLGSDYRLRFLTEPAEPALTLPGVSGHFLNVPTDRPVVLDTEGTNLSALDLRLYSLDEATLLRTLGFSSDNWRNFVPERYGQTLIRSWRVALDDFPNETVRTSLTITNTDAQPLASGAYYLQIRTPEGPGEDLVLLVSDIELALKHNDSQVLVWAVDTLTGAPVADLSLTIYQGDAVVARSRSDINGLWQVAHQRLPNDPPYIVIASGPEPAVVSDGWQLHTSEASVDRRAAEKYQLALRTDRSAYFPGDTIRIGGFARRLLPDGSLDLPPSGIRLDLALQQTTSNTVMTRTTVALLSSGVISAELPLAPEMSSGRYAVRATLEGEITHLPLQVLAPDPSFDLTFGAAQFDANVPPDVLPLRVTDEGIPLAGVTVTWSARGLSIEPEADSPDGFHFGDDEQALTRVHLEGSGQTDADGRFDVALLDPATLTQTMRYDITVTVQEPGGPSAEVTTTHTVRPSGIRAGLRLASQVVALGEQAIVEMLAVDADGDPVPGADVTLELYRRTWPQLAPSSASASPEPRDTPVLVRQSTTDDRGRSQLVLPVLEGGEYRVVAGAGSYRSTASLWSATPDYTNWRTRDNEVIVVTDRQSYRPGETARLLVGLPTREATVLTTIEQTDAISAVVQPLRAGQLLDILITPDMAPNTYVGVLVTQGEYAGMRVGYVPLNVMTESPVLTTTLTTDQTDYQPGATATLTITTRNLQGEAVPAQLIVTATEVPDEYADGSQASGSMPFRFAPTRAPTFATASGSVLRQSASAYGALISRNPQPEPIPEGPVQPTRVAYWDTAGRTGPDGTLVVSLPLPAEPATWRVDVYAATRSNLFGYASTTLTTSVPIEVQALVPPMLRVGDSTTATLVVRNTTALSQEIRATLTASGVTIAEAGSARQTRVVQPGATHRFTWTIGTRHDPTDIPATATLRFGAEAADTPSARAIVTLPIEPGGATGVRARTFELSTPISHTIAFPTPAAPQAQPEQPGVECSLPAERCPWAKLELAIAPDIRAAVAAGATALADRPSRSVEQEASLLLLSAILAEDAPRDEQPVWEAHARSALAALQAAQHSSGGWGWWPGGPAHPFMTGYVLEAQAAARDAFALDIEPDSRALKLLREISQSEADPDLRAYVHYVLARVGQGDPARLRALLDLDLHAEGLAYAALALPPDQASVPLSRLLALSQRSTVPSGESGEVGLYWEPAGTTRVVRSVVSTTALAAHALQQHRPNSPSLARALQTLRQTWGVDGWATGIDSARAAAALLAGTAPAGAHAGRSYTVSVNDQLVLNRTWMLTTTHRVTLAGNQLRPRNTLRVVTHGGSSGGESETAPAPALLAYRLVAQIPENPPRSDTLVVHHDYLDPHSNALLDPEALQPGQLVRIRLTLVALAPMDFVAVDVPLPAALAPVAPAEQPAMNEQRRTGHNPLPAFGTLASDEAVTFLGSDLVPRVYTPTYLARVVATGTFAVPPPRATPAFDSHEGATGSSGRIVVTQP